MKKKLEAIFMFVLFGLVTTFIACEDDESPTVIRPEYNQQPFKYKERDMVIIFNDEKGMIIKLDSNDHTYLVRFVSDGLKENWFQEDQLRLQDADDFVLSKQSVQRKEYLSKQEYIRMNFMQTMMVVNGYKMAAQSDIEVNTSYSANGVYNRLKAIDSVFHSELDKLASDVNISQPVGNQ